MSPRKSSQALIALVLTCLTTIVTASPETDQKILAIPSKSSCASHVFQKRGQAPAGYLKGIALVYAKRSCELKQHADTAVVIMSAKASDPKSDALEWYGKASGTDQDRLRSLFVLLIGEGMRESSGNPTEGYDLTVRRQNAEIAEAGLFQVSHDSLGRSIYLQKVVAQYSNNPNSCLLNTFMEGVHDRKREVFGEGPGAEFQTQTKSCPALAVDYAAILLRVNRQHFGPINRKEAELVPECEQMLRNVEDATNSSCP